MLHMMRKMRKYRSNVWTPRENSALLCGTRYRIYRVPHITLRESTHNSRFCAKNTIFVYGKVQTMV